MKPRVYLGSSTDGEGVVSPEFDLLFRLNRPIPRAPHGTLLAHVLLNGGGYASVFAGGGPSHCYQVAGLDEVPRLSKPVVGDPVVVSIKIRGVARALRARVDLDRSSRARSARHPLHCDDDGPGDAHRSSKSRPYRLVGDPVALIYALSPTPKSTVSLFELRARFDRRLPRRASVGVRARFTVDGTGGEHPPRLMRGSDGYCYEQVIADEVDSPLLERARRGGRARVQLVIHGIRRPIVRHVGFTTDKSAAPTGCHVDPNQKP